MARLTDRSGVPLPRNEGSPSVFSPEAIASPQSRLEVGPEGLKEAAGRMRDWEGDKVPAHRRALLPLEFAALPLDRRPVSARHPSTRGRGNCPSASTAPDSHPDPPPGAALARGAECRSRLRFLPPRGALLDRLGSG